MTRGGDCNDLLPGVNPGLAGGDFCDGRDNDCDRDIDKDAPEIEIGCCCDTPLGCQQAWRAEDVVRVCSGGSYVCDIRGPTAPVMMCDTDDQ